MVRICVVDDDILARDALTLGLADAGHEVIAAPGAAAGLDMIDRRGADALVTDINMPGTDGGQLIAEARRRWPHMPIVAISGADTMAGENLENAAKRLGADAVLLKPFRAPDLVEVLHRLFASRSAPPAG